MPQRPYPSAVEKARLTSKDRSRRLRRAVARRRRRRYWRHAYNGRTVIYVASGGDTWSEYLQRMIRARGLSKAELARRAGIARQTISEWANRGAGPDLAVDLVVRVARALGDDPTNALRAAAKMAPLPEGDPDIARIVAADWPPDVKARMIERLLAGRQAAQGETPEEPDESGQVAS